jgi:RimJ/RimL family protein N-acetyltransferase
MVVADRIHDQAFGTVTFEFFSDDRTTCSMGCLLHPDSRGIGIGREAVALAGQMCSALGVTSIRIGTSVSNIAMQRSAVDGGAVFVNEGLHTLPNGERVIARWYELSAKQAVEETATKRSFG